jgi:hypothetical protein
LNESNERLSPTPSPVAMRGWLPPLADDHDERPDARLPPLRIHHILVWTACSAFGMTAVHAMATRFGTSHLRSPANALPLIQVVFELTFGIGFGAHLLVCFAGMCWRRKGIAFPSQPGHWVAYASAVWQLAILAFGMVVVLANDESSILSDGRGSAIIVMLFLAIGGTGAMLMRAAKAFLRPWAAALAISGFSIVALMSAVILSWIAGLISTASAFLLGICFVSMAVACFGIVAALVVFLVAVWVDVRQRIPRHWAHWLAVWTLLAQIGALVLVTMIWPVFGYG